MATLSLERGKDGNLKLVVKYGSSFWGALFGHRSAIERAFDEQKIPGRFGKCYLNGVWRLIHRPGQNDFYFEYYKDGLVEVEESPGKETPE